jgi:hypothetical protein
MRFLGLGYKIHMCFLSVVSLWAESDRFVMRGEVNLWVCSSRCGIAVLRLAFAASFNCLVIRAVPAFALCARRVEKSLGKAHATEPIDRLN